MINEINFSRGDELIRFYRPDMKSHLLFVTVSNSTDVCGFILSKTQIADLIEFLEEHFVNSE